MTGFQQNVTQNIDIGETPSLNIDGTERSDSTRFIKAAEFGLQLFNRHAQQKKVDMAIKRDEAINQAVLNSVTELEDIKLQKGTLSTFDVLKVSKNSRGLFAESPADQDEYDNRLSEKLASPLFKTAVGDPLAEQEKTRNALRKLDPLALTLAVRSKGYDDINEIPDDQLGETELLTLEIQARQEGVRQEKQKAVDHPSVKQYQKASAAAISSGLMNITAGISTTIRNFSEAGLTTVETKQRFDEIKSNLVLTVNTLKNDVVALGAQVVATDGVTAKDIIAIDRTKARTAEFLDNIMQQFEQTTEDEFKKTGRLYQELEQTGDINNIQLYGEVAKLRKLLGGESFSALMTGVLARGNINLDAANNVLEQGISSVVQSGHDVDFSAVAESTRGVAFTNYHKVLEGESLGDTPNDVTQAWETVDNLIRNPAFLDKLDEKTRDNLALSSLTVFRFAGELGTPEDKANASKLVTSPEFTNFLNKINPKDSAQLSNEAASFVADSASLLFKRNKGLVFNTETGKLEKIKGGEADLNARSLKEETKRVPGFVSPGEGRTPSFPDPTQGRKRSAAKKTETEIDKLNKELDSATQILINHNNFLKGRTALEAKNYLMGLVNDEFIKGKRIEFSPAEDRAIRDGLTKEDLETQLTLQDQLAKDEELVKNFRDKIINNQGLRSLFNGDLNEEEVDKILKQIQPQKKS